VSRAPWLLSIRYFYFGVNQMSTINRLMTVALFAWGAITTHAEAKEARVHAFACKTFGGMPIDHDFSLQNDSPDQEMYVVCPLPDTSGFRKDEIRTLNVHVHIPNPTSPTRQITAKLCTSTWYATRGKCGFGTALFLSGDRTIELDSLDYFKEILTVDHASDFGYLHLNLPPKSTNGSRSAFRGYFISN
jgi:hypothetical protein